MSSCPICGANLVPGVMWCGVCGANVVDPSIGGRLASPVRRLVAHIVDVALIACLLWINVIAGLGGLILGVATRDEGGLFFALLVTVVGLALLIAYVIWYLRLLPLGMTPGKKFMDLQVIRADGRPPELLLMLAREFIGKSISGLIFSLGYLWILFDQQKQGWHDKLVQTWVIHSSPQSAPPSGWSQD